jgi:hypothetical protein
LWSLLNVNELSINQCGIICAISLLLVRASSLIVTEKAISFFSAWFDPLLVVRAISLSDLIVTHRYSALLRDLFANYLLRNNGMHAFPLLSCVISWLSSFVACFFGSIACIHFSTLGILGSLVKSLNQTPAKC